MGRDKALLPDPLHGTLLQRQLALVTTLGPAEVLVSCRADQALGPLAAARCIHDMGTHGPLGGLSALLEAMEGEMLLVLAVDLGAMTADVLAPVLAAARPGVGVVPRTVRGIEPLAAVYPKVLAAEAARRLVTDGDHSLQGFVRAGVASGHLAWYNVPESATEAFANWNAPGDLPPRAPRIG